MHIGLTGTNAAGKTTILTYLANKGYRHYSLSDILRDELQRRRKAINRENLIQIGNLLREKFGPGVLAEKITKQLRSNYSVIDSIRNPAEVEVLRKLNHFILLAVDAPVEIRYERALTRNRNENAPTLEEFKHIEALEHSEKMNAQNLAACMKMADFHIVNNGSESQLLRKVDKILAAAAAHIRPSWDEYFLKMTFLVAERSTCLRHHVGSIIVKDRQVLATGYNGAARGTQDCLELGCLRDELKIPSGERHEICRGIHAEQNTIIQAARHGVNINNSTIYCTHSPCIICAKMIVNAGIKRIVVCGDYPDLLNMAGALYEEAGVQFERIPIMNMVINVLK